MLLRQNRIRGLLAGGVALVLLLSPFRTSESLVAALACLTGYVAFVGMATWWVLHRQRVKLSLMRPPLELRSSMDFTATPP